MNAQIDVTRTVAELLLENPLRAIVFERHRIDYCCNGKKSLTEACMRRGLDADSIAAELLTNTPHSTTENAECKAALATDCASLVAHIVDYHHAFLRRELPRLGTLAEKVARVHGDHAPECVLVNQTFVAMRAELESHMEKEEGVLFPFIVKLEGGTDSPFPTIGSPINCMEHEHTEVGEALERLTELTNAYQPPMDACNSWRVLYHGLAELERDLHQHIHEENNVLFPRALAMEAAIRNNASAPLSN